ncbi:hypothetical protein [Neoaquamicrobium sediminum]|uniref:hypothetical protein n=1 Tax=Neoaquamicrobium sediminum TaxID=1849104 RepID=UPI003BA99C2D
MDSADCPIYRFTRAGHGVQTGFVVPVIGDIQIIGETTMKSTKILTIAAIAACLSAPASAERYTIAVKTATGTGVTSFGASDSSGGYCADGSRIVSLEICRRTLYACEASLSRARQAMVQSQGFFEVRYSDRSGNPKAC